MFLKKVVEKMKTYFILDIFSPKNGIVYEIMWKNILEPNR